MANSQSDYEISIGNLTYTHTSVGLPSLSNVSMYLPKGSRTILVGANGAGKSTLLQILAGKRLILNEGTHVHIKGRDVFRNSPPGVTFLGTEWAMNPVVRSDIVVNDFLNSVGGWRHKERRDRLLDILDVDLDWHMHAISDGERRRVQLVMGLMSDWDVLLLDEVTVDLDVLVRDDLLKFLRTDSQTRGATILYATHIFDGLNDFPTHVAHMHLGTFLSQPAPWPMTPEAASQVVLVDLGSNPTLYKLALQWLREDRDRRRLLESEGRKTRGARQDAVPSDSETFYRNTCTECPTPYCVPNASTSTSSSSVSSGAVAGAVVASIVFLVIAIGAFWFYRRRQRHRRAAAVAQDAKPDVPARAEDVLNRPDPNEKSESEHEESTLRIYPGTNGGTINLDPESQHGSTTYDGHSRCESDHSNPFGDNHSIQTTSTGTHSNVIPIALVPPASLAGASQQSNVSSTQTTNGSSASGPVRPVRAPDLDLTMDNPNADAESQLSDLPAPNNRASYLSTGSFASDVLSEAPVIVTPARGIVKQQVVGLVKAEVIRTSPGDSLRAPANRPPVRSPLAGSSFGPADVVHEAVEEEQDIAMRGNPFSDEHAQRSPAPSSATFGSVVASPSQYSEAPSTQLAEESGGVDRPLSTYTQAASIVGSVISASVGSATRVHLGLNQYGGLPTGPMPQTASSGVLNSPRSPYRLTSARLVNAAPAGNNGGALEQQQHLAMQEIDGQGKRLSFSSVVSSTSTRADSILEGFHFVPPSPISNRPIRTPPRSPLAQQSFGTNNGNSGGASQPAPSQETSALRSVSRDPELASPPPAKPFSRKSHALSIASQSSTLSNGLGSFPFQIDSGTGSDNAASTSPPSSFMGRQRASLDTLALTSDLSSYPLNFDRQTPPPPLPRP
ncbi:uncharacterized protein FIBRA_05476 [Fibroporia radiculosa]|uniref:ABC transporter domain-containing protein n=1 Tax=Fibroporia radiculosa TaxID=599839 RepID=J4HXL2_9APHY|nr:uncharacterized protein FIBRA_05476 [Fibroporia radiculosa]CCM03347.1 predicted protein [Fibroporia radiculosa]